MKLFQPSSRSCRPLWTAFCGLLIWGFADQAAFAQTVESLPEKWYCDRRLKKLPYLRSGKVTYISKFEEAARNDLIKEFVSGNIVYTVENVIYLELTDLYTGKEVTERYEFLNVRTGDLPARRFKVGETYLFEADKLGLEYRGKGTYAKHLPFIAPSDYFKTYREAADDVKFFNLVKNAASEKETTLPDKAITGGILGGKATRLVKPAFPASLKKKKVGETIEIAVLIDETGKVIKAKAYCFTYKELADAAVAAALVSSFSPTVIGGKAVKVKGVIVYNFAAD